MTTIRARDPGDGPAMAGLPPLPIGALVLGAHNLMAEAADLPAPVQLTICDTQAITVQFGPDPSSLRAITLWALRFGGALTSEPHQGPDGPQTWCRTQFGYHGVTVRAFAHIRAATGRRVCICGDPGCGYRPGTPPAAAT